MNAQTLCSVVVFVGPGDRRPTKRMVRASLTQKRLIDVNDQEVYIRHARTWPQMQQALKKMGLRPIYMLVTKSTTAGAKKHASYIVQ